MKQNIGQDIKNSMDLESNEKLRELFPPLYIYLSFINLQLNSHQMEIKAFHLVKVLLYDLFSNFANYDRFTLFLSVKMISLYKSRSMNN